MQTRSMLFLAAATLLTTTAPAHAVQAGNGASGQSHNKSAKEATATDGERKICRRPDTSGTRLVEKMCLTKEQWKKVDAQG